MGRYSSPPPERLRAATGFGRLIAAGMMDRAACLEALAAGQGLCARVRLADALTDATLAWREKRHFARLAVRDAMAEVLDGPAPEVRLAPAPEAHLGPALRRVAHAANHDLGLPLREVEVEAMAATVLARALSHHIEALHA